jgi:DNA adenine methylase
VRFLEGMTEGLLFLDPPYYLGHGSKLYGNKGNLHIRFDHAKLANILKNKQNWIMTYNDCEYIRVLYKDYEIIDTNWTYGMNASKESSEIIVISD